MESKLTFRAGRQVAIGYDGGEIKVFEPDEEIPGAAELPTFPGLPSAAAGDGTTRPVRKTSNDAALVEARAALARAVAGYELGVPADELPPYAELLLMPMLTEGEVSVR